MRGPSAAESLVPSSGSCNPCGLHYILLFLMQAWLVALGVHDGWPMRSLRCWARLGYGAKFKAVHWTTHLNPCLFHSRLLNPPQATLRVGEAPPSSWVSTCGRPFLRSQPARLARRQSSTPLVRAARGRGAMYHAQDELAACSGMTQALPQLPHLAAPKQPFSCLASHHPGSENLI